MPLIRGTIDTLVADAFVGVTVACRIRTGDIKKKATGKALLW